MLLTLSEDGKKFRRKINLMLSIVLLLKKKRKTENDRMLSKMVIKAKIMPIMVLNRQKVSKVTTTI